MRLVTIAICVLLTGCAAVPKVDDTPRPAGQPQIVSTSGPLSVSQSNGVLARIAPKSESANLIKKHTAIEQAEGNTPMVAGNSTRLLIDGAQTFAAMFAAIQNAKLTVDLEYYLFEDVQSQGESLGDLLITKRRQGVDINIIYDSFGSSSTPSIFFKRMKDAGINVVAFNPINMLNPVGLNMRDHRKLLLVDGQRAIVGGVNLSSTYQGSMPGKSGSPAGKQAEHWRDTDIEIEGPVVSELQNIFFAHWSQAGGPSLARDKYFPKLSVEGNQVIRVVGSSPDKKVPRYYVTLLSNIQEAEKNVWLSAGYFVPTDQEEEDLISAAKRGVDVRLLLPSDSDSKMALAIGRSHYGYLLDAGVKIYEVQNEVLHSKTVTIDAVWTAVGSSNFDPRSVVFNDEVDAIVLGTKTAQAFEAMFQSDFEKAKQIDATAWRRRPISERLLELFELAASLWQNWL